MKTFDEAVRHDLAAAPQPASLDRLRWLTRRRRARRTLPGAVSLLVVVIVVGFLLNSTQHSRGVEVSASSTPTQSASTTTPDPRGATANVAYVKRLVTENRLPHSSAVTGVRAEADEIVVSTSLTDTISAEELWEGLKLAIGCDDSFLGIKGYFVVLKDGSRVDKPRHANFNCASAESPTPTVITSTGPADPVLINALAAELPPSYHLHSSDSSIDQTGHHFEEAIFTDQLASVARASVFDISPPGASFEQMLSTTPSVTPGGGYVPSGTPDVYMQKSNNFGSGVIAKLTGHRALIVSSSISLAHYGTTHPLSTTFLVHAAADLAARL